MGASKSKGAKGGKGDLKKRVSEKPAADPKKPDAKPDARKSTNKADQQLIPSNAMAGRGAEAVDKDLADAKKLAAIKAKVEAKKKMEATAKRKYATQNTAVTAGDSDMQTKLDALKSYKGGPCK